MSKFLYLIYILTHFVLFYDNVYIGDNTLELVNQKQERYLEEIIVKDGKGTPVFTGIDRSDGLKRTDRINLFYQYKEKVFPILFESRASAIPFYSIMLLNKFMGIKNALFTFFLCVNMLTIYFVMKVFKDRSLLFFLILDPILMYASQPYVAESLHRLFFVIGLYLISLNKVKTAGLIFGLNLFTTVKSIWIMTSGLVVFSKLFDFKNNLLKLLIGSSIPILLYLFLFDFNELINTRTELGAGYFSEIKGYFIHPIFYDIYDFFFCRTCFLDYHFNQAKYVERINGMSQSIRFFLPAIAIILCWLRNFKDTWKYIVSIFIYSFIFFLSLPEYFSYSKYMGEASLFFSLGTWIVYKNSNKATRIILAFSWLLVFLDWSNSFYNNLNPSGMKNSKNIEKVISFLDPNKNTYYFDDGYLSSEPVSLFNPQMNVYVVNKNGFSIKDAIKYLDGNFIIPIDSVYSSWQKEGLELLKEPVLIGLKRHVINEVIVIKK